MGESEQGRIIPATRERLRAWLARFEGKEVEAVLEAAAGWLFVVEELERAAVRPHLVEPAETHARRSPKRRAKTDRLDARHLRELLQLGRLPESWIPSAPVAIRRPRRGPPPLAPVPELELLRVSLRAASPAPAG